MKRKIPNFGIIASLVASIAGGLILVLFNKVEIKLVVFWLVVFIILLALFLYFFSEKKEEIIDNKNIKQPNEKIVKDTATNTSDGIFLHREKAIKTIISFLKHHSIIIIKGCPGMGKSTLVNHLKIDQKVVHEFTSCFVNLKAFSSENYDNIQNIICDKVLEELPLSLNDRLIYQKSDFSPFEKVSSCLKNQSNLLIILDNTEQINDIDLEETVLEWTNKSLQNIRFILTSRKIHKKSNKMNFGILYELKPLKTRKTTTEKLTEACDLLIEKIKLIKREQGIDWQYKSSEKNNKSLFEITKKTQGIPWCIHHVAGIFKNLDSLLELENEITDVVIPLNKLDAGTNAFIERSFQLMHSEAREGFIHLCLYDDSFDKNAYNNIIDSEYKNEILKNLDDNSFIDRDPDSKRYQFYVHAKEYGREKLKQIDEKRYIVLKERFTNYYLNIAELNSKIEVSDSDETKENKRKIIKNELNNFLKTQFLLIESNQQDKASNLALLINEAIESEGFISIREKLLKNSYDSYKEETNALKVTLCLRLSEIYFTFGNWIKAESYAKKAIYNSQSVPTLKIKSLVKLGKIYKDRGFLCESLRLLNDAYSLLKKQPEKDQTLENLSFSENLNVLDQLGRLSEFDKLAKELKHESLTIESARKHNRIGLKHWHHGNISDAIKEFERAKEIAISKDNSSWLAAFKTNGALALIDKEEYAKAVEIFMTNISAHRISGRKAWQSVNDGGIGRAHLRRNNNKVDYKIAEQRLIKALITAKEIDYPENITFLQGDLASVYLHRKLLDITKSFKLIIEVLSLHKKMGAVRSTRYFSNYITLLTIIKRQDNEINKIMLLEVFYVLFDLYKNYILTEVTSLSLPLQKDIEQLKVLTKHYCKIELDSIINRTIEDSLSILMSDIYFPYNIQVIESNISNQKEGAYEYYADETENQWKYFSPMDTVTIFAYGLLLNNSYLNIYSPIDKVKTAKAFGFLKKCNHVLPEYENYFEKELFSNGKAILNLDYTGFSSDETYGVLIKLSKESFLKLENDEKGYALRPITYQELDDKSKIGKAYTLTSTNRVYMKQKLTNDKAENNQDYLNLCKEGARGYGEEFFNLWSIDL